MALKANGNTGLDEDRPTKVFEILWIELSSSNF